MNKTGSDHRLFVLGGHLMREHAAVYDTIANRWTRLRDNGQRYAARALLRGSVAWLLGGRAGTPADEIHLYEIENNVWCQGPRLPEPLAWFAAEQVGGKIYVIGGETPGIPSSRAWEGTVNCPLP